MRTALPVAPRPALTPASPRAFLGAAPVIAAVLLLGALLAPGPALGQGSGGPLWVPLDSQPPGTPARVILNADLSSPSQTYFDVFISGFYVTTRVGADGLTYQDVSVPGLPSYAAPGEPRVPVVREDLAIVMNTGAVSPAPASVFDLRALPGYLVWPSPIPAQIHDGTPAQFVRDSTTYASTGDFPPGDGVGGPIRPALGGIPASLCTAYPVHWNPASGTLSVAAHVRFGYTHGGGLNTPMSLTLEHANEASSALVNWSAVSSAVAINWNQFNGAYLFVCPSAWSAALQPLIQEKKTRGFAVTVLNVPLNGETCTQLRQSIQTWYAGARPGDDHYCLLVGSTGSTPYCCVGNSQPGCDQFSQVTDKVLSSVDGDLEPEIYLGRLYVGGAAELQTQVKKILDYETGPQVNHDGNVLLVAHHQQDQDFDFVSYQEAVRTASYAQVTPGFSTCYGTNPALGNGDIASGFAGGVGVVAYMGHGEPGAWRQWTYSGDSFTQSDAAALTNGALTPVVWSIACQTGDPRVSLSLASGFMKNAQGGSVAFYGAVDETYGSVVQIMDDSLFQAVYGRGITRHGMAIDYAEHATIAADSLWGGDAVHKYLLYGDPEMEVKRHNAGGIWSPINMLAPPALVAPCPGPGCCPTCPPPIVDILVRDASGAPVPGVKVALWKPTMAGTDEVLDNRYSGSDGWAHVPAAGLTAGTLYVGLDDGDGRAGLDSIPVQPSITAVGTADTLPLRFAARPSVTAGAARFAFGRALGGPARVSIFGVDGRLVRMLEAPPGAAFLRWDGCDQAGRPVAAGLYLARFTAGAVHAEARVVVVR